MNGVNERIDESVLKWFGNIERMGNDKRIFVEMCV